MMSTISISNKAFPKRETNGYTSGESAELCGMKPFNLRFWMKSGWLISILGEKKEISFGKWSHFSQAQLLMIKIANDLSRIVSPQIAIPCAAQTGSLAGHGSYRFELFNVDGLMFGGLAGSNLAFGISGSEMQTEGLIPFAIVSIPPPALKVLPKP